MTQLLVLPLFASLAEFERDIIRERTMAGLNAARARGRIGGRPKKIDENKLTMAKSMMTDKNISIKDICKILEVSKATLYKSLKEASETK